MSNNKKVNSYCHRLEDGSELEVQVTHPEGWFAGEIIFDCANEVAGRHVKVTLTPAGSDYHSVLVADSRSGELLSASARRPCAPLREPVPPASLDRCTWPGCANPALCSSGTFGDQLVCVDHFAVTNGPANTQEAVDAFRTALWAHGGPAPRKPYASPTVTELAPTSGPIPAVLKVDRDDLARMLVSLELVAGVLRAWTTPEADH